MESKKLETNVNNRPVTVAAQKDLSGGTAQLSSRDR